MKLGYQILVTALGASTLLHVLAVVLFSNEHTKDTIDDQSAIILTLLTNEVSERRPREIAVIGHDIPSMPPIPHPNNSAAIPPAIIQQPLDAPSRPLHSGRIIKTTEFRKVLKPRKAVDPIHWQKIQQTTLYETAKAPEAPNLIRAEDAPGDLPSAPPELIFASQLKVSLHNELLPPPTPSHFLPHTPPGNAEPVQQALPPRVISGETLVRVLDRNENTAEYHSTQLLNPPPSYPRRARREGLEGRVVLSVLVTNTGSVKHISILETSGVSILDSAAVTAVTEWSFVPAKIKNGSVESTKLIPIRFRLRD